MKVSGKYKRSANRIFSQTVLKFKGKRISMYKQLLMLVASFFVLVSTGFSSPIKKTGVLPDEIVSYYSNFNYLSSLKAGIEVADSTKPSESELKEMLRDATDLKEQNGKSIVSPDEKEGPWAHRTVGNLFHTLEIEKYKISPDQIVLHVRSLPIGNGRKVLASSNGHPSYGASRQIHRWYRQNGQWIKEALMIQKL